VLPFSQFFIVEMSHRYIDERRTKSSKYAVHPGSPASGRGGAPTLGQSIELLVHELEHEEEEAAHQRTILSFLGELMVFIPFDLLAGASGYKGFQFLRLTRLLEFMRIPEHVEEIFTVLEDHEISLSAALKRTIKLALYYIISTHFAGCVFFATSYNEALLGREGWAFQDSLITIQEVECNNSNCSAPTVLVVQNIADRSTQYLRSLYWAVITMVTVSLRFFFFEN
jgi:hypothetical protein